jgi:hypothetical protein
MQSQLLEVNTLLKPTSKSIEHIEEGTTEPMQVEKDITAQSEEAVECNINEPIGHDKLKGDTLDVDSDVEPTER